MIISDFYMLITLSGRQVYIRRWLIIKNILLKSDDEVLRARTYFHDNLPTRNSTAFE